MQGSQGGCVVEFEVGIRRGEGWVVMLVDQDGAPRGGHGKRSDRKTAEGQDEQECFVLPIKIVYVAINVHESEKRTFSNIKKMLMSLFGWTFTKSLCIQLTLYFPQDTGLISSNFMPQTADQRRRQDNEWIQRNKVIQIGFRFQLRSWPAACPQENYLTSLTLYSPLQNGIRVASSRHCEHYIKTKINMSHASYSSRY